MTTISTKLAFVALAVAMVATPAVAANKHHPATVYYRGLQNSAVGSPQNYVGTYPNFATRDGSAYSVESGEADNLIR
jgi:hypothetical protein